MWDPEQVAGLRPRADAVDGVDDRDRAEADGGGRAHGGVLDGAGDRAGAGRLAVCGMLCAREPVRQCAGGVAAGGLICDAGAIGLLL
jgi:hypothetical protein